jgi:hypothetical protein
MEWDRTEQSAEERAACVVHELEVIVKAETGILAVLPKCEY